MYESQNTKVGAAAFKARVVELLASASASGIVTPGMADFGVSIADDSSLRGEA
jgi:hypothetical protein